MILSVRTMLKKCFNEAVHIFINFRFKVNVNSSDHYRSYLETHGVYSAEIVSISLYQIEGLRGDLMVTWLFGKLPLDWIQGRLQIYIPKRKLCFFLKHGEKLRIEERQHEGCCQVRLYYAGFFPCTTLYDPCMASDAKT